MYIKEMKNLMFFILPRSQDIDKLLTKFHFTNSR